MLMIISLALFVSCASAIAQSTYSLTPVAAPVPASFNFATGLDEGGNVLLNVTVDTSGPPELWISGPAGVRQLATMPSATSIYAVQLSDFGRVLGSMNRRPTV